MATFRTLRVLKGEVHARRMYFDEARNALYLTSYFYGKLIALDLETGRRAWEVKVGGKPYGLAVDSGGRTAYVNSMVGIVKVDLDTLWERYRPAAR